MPIIPAVKEAEAGWRFELNSKPVLARLLFGAGGEKESGWLAGWLTLFFILGGVSVVSGVLRHVANLFAIPVQVVKVFREPGVVWYFLFRSEVGIYAVLTMLTSNSKRNSCLCLPNASYRHLPPCLDFLHRTLDKVLTEEHRNFFQEKLLLVKDEERGTWG